MDVAALLRDLRDQRGWSTTQLAAYGGTSRSVLTDWESGRKSPTVATLNRVLAAVGLQIRAELEPLLAPLDERVDAVLTAPEAWGASELEALRRVVEALAGEHPFVVDRGWGNEPERGTGEIRWAFDGETALRLQGLGFRAETLELVVVFDATARTFFFRQQVRGTGGPPVSWFEVPTPVAQQCLGGLAFGPFGMVRVRLLDEAEEIGAATVRVEAAPGLVVPVLTLQAVERGRPDLADVLARLRERRSRPAV